MNRPADNPSVRFDAGREARIGMAEAILADVKTPAQVAEALVQAERITGRALVTRLTPDVFGALPDDLRTRLSYEEDSRTAILGELDVPDVAPRVAVLTGGTGDIGVAREAARTLAFHGVGCLELADVGVAGLWRLMEHKETVAAMRIVIVCAGMEGALFSVVGGLAPGVIIAVPTSNGYGVSEGGRVALDSALASCAPGIMVTNIDNGYGAACAALRVLAPHGPAPSDAN